MSNSINISHNRLLTSVPFFLIYLMFSLAMEMSPFEGIMYLNFLNCCLVCYCRILYCDKNEKLATQKSTMALNWHNRVKQRRIPDRIRNTLRKCIFYNVNIMSAHAHVGLQGKKTQKNRKKKEKQGQESRVEHYRLTTLV